MSFLYQFHIHTEYSPDSCVSLDRLYKCLLKNKISGVIITDHNTTNGAFKFKQKYGCKLDVIIGEEIMTKKGEIIGMFLKEGIPKGLTPEETIRRIKKQSGLVCIPHPFDRKRYKTCLELDSIIKNKDNIDIIEIFNGRVIESEFNKSAEKLSHDLNKPCIYGSDSHSCYELKYNCCDFKNNLTRGNFIESLKYINIYNKRTNKSIHYYTTYVKVKKLIKAGKISEAFNFIYKGCKKRLLRAFKVNR